MPLDTTDFGFDTIPLAEKQTRVDDVFHSVASRYDLMNDLMSLGIHRYWKAYAIDRLHLKPGQMVLDLASGTGDLIQPMVRALKGKGTLFMSDINRSMLTTGINRLFDKGITKPVVPLQINAEALPFPDNSLDRISIAFGLRNVPQKEKALKEMARVLKPGGRLMVLEFSKPTNGEFAKLYDWYSFNVVPKLGRAILNDQDSYQYLVESIRKHPDQATLSAMMQDSGFDEVTHQNMTGGIVACHVGSVF